METKWTLGPWRYDRTNGSPTTGQHMIAGGKPGYLAEARDCGSGDVIANAHLIASAPDLYEALEAIRDNEVVRAVCPSPLWAKMADALLKARGETA